MLKSRFEINYPYSMDDMMDLDIDILLKQPNMLVLSRGGSDLEKFINRILDSGKAELPKGTKYYIVQAITGKFVEHHLEPLFFTGVSQAKEALQEIYDETQTRLQIIRLNKDMSRKGVFIGAPIYFLIDSFSYLEKKEYIPMGQQLSRVINCARQTNIRTIVFETPASFNATESGMFSALSILPGGYTEKFKTSVPPNFIPPKTGEFFLASHCGRSGLHKI